MRVPVGASEVLASPEARAAVLSGKRGTLIRLAREAMGLRQTDLGRLLGYSQSTISRIESGRQHANDMSVLSAAAELLGIPPAMLGLAATPGAPGPAFTHPGSGAVRRDDVNRIEFLGLVAGTAAGSVVLGHETERRQLGMRDARMLRSDLRRLYELDDQHGGGDVYSLAARTAGTVRRTVDHATYREPAGRALWSMIGELTEHVGWLAYDSERHDEARRWWLEALHVARLLDDGRVETVVMASMSLQAGRRGTGREAIELAHAAQKAARQWGTPRLRSLLFAREALGHARSQDTTTALRTLRRATVELDRGRTDDDPLWLDFYGEADLCWHRMLAALDRQDLPGAEQAIRAALSAVGPSFPRNHALYLAELAEVLIARGRIDEGLQVASRAVSRASELGSRRVDLEVDAVRRRLAPFWRLPEVRGFLDWSAQLMPGRVTLMPGLGSGPDHGRARSRTSA
ncbi:MAG TPA: helix-turn-helix transcriptional regulator [Mycobacteriales bacterium]